MHIWLPRRPELLPTLDERLTAAAALVREGEPVADIGCDHGKLTAVLAASGIHPYGMSTSKTQTSKRFHP